MMVDYEKIQSLTRGRASIYSRSGGEKGLEGRFAAQAV